MRADRVSRAHFVSAGSYCGCDFEPIFTVFCWSTRTGKSSLKVKGPGSHRIYYLQLEYAPASVSCYLVQSSSTLWKVPPWARARAVWNCERGMAGLTRALQRGSSSPPGPWLPPELLLVGAPGQEGHGLPQVLLPVVVHPHQGGALPHQLVTSQPKVWGSGQTWHCHWTAISIQEDTLCRQNPLGA